MHVDNLAQFLYAGADTDQLQLFFWLSNALQCYMEQDIEAYPDAQWLIAIRKLQGQLMAMHTEKEVKQIPTTRFQNGWNIGRTALEAV